MLRYRKHCGHLVEYTHQSYKISYETRNESVLHDNLCCIMKLLYNQLTLTRKHSSKMHTTHLLTVSNGIQVPFQGASTHPSPLKPHVLAEVVDNHPPWTYSPSFWTYPPLWTYSSLQTYVYIFIPWKGHGTGDTPCEQNDRHL